jgi:hypothetical protein
MAQSATEFNNIAAFYCQIAFRDSNGYPAGQTTAPDSMANGATSSAYLVNGLIDVVPGVATHPVVTNQGGQRVISKTPLPANDYGVPTFSLSQRDEQLEAYLSSSALDTSYNAEWMVRGANVAQEDFPSFVVLFAIQGTDSTTMAQWWDNYLFYNCRVIKTTDAGAGQVTGDVTNPNPLTYTLQLSLSTRHPSGTLLSAMNMSVKNNEDAWGFIRSDNPLGLTTYKDDNSTGTFTLGYRPVNNSATGANQNNITEAGTQTAVTSVNTTTGLVTQTAPAALATMIEALYETNFVAI